MKKRERPELLDNETYLSEEDVDIEVGVDEEETAVYVKFSGFSDLESAKEYASMLAESLPLLLLETIQIH